MIPKVNQRGHSFKGVMAYLMHDKEAETSERVAWSETGNMITNDPEKAAFVMAWTDQNADILKRDFGGSLAGKTTEAGGVYHYSLSWAHGEQPDHEHQRAQALETLERLGLKEHEYVFVAHNDTDHAHLHVVANLTNPETGKRHTPSFDKRELQSYALEYEREHGLHCSEREENAAKRERGEHSKYQQQKQDYSEKITRAYYAADNGKAFINALDAEGLQLAKARRGNGFVVVDETGDIQKLARQLDITEKGKEKTAAINAKLADIEREKLLDADVLAKQIKAEIAEQSKSFDRDAQEVKQQKDLAEAAHQSGEEKAQLQAKKEAATAALNKAEKQYQQARIEILTASKNDWTDLNTQQYQERTNLEEKLRQQDSQKEKTHRQHWQTIVEKDERIKAQLETDLNKSGYAGLWFRFRHGKEAREEIEALDKNLENSRLRLAEGVGGLSSSDRFALKNLGKLHNEQRKDLRGRITDELKLADEQARTETENKLLQEAVSSPENAERLQYSVTAKTTSQKSEISRVNAKAAAHKELIVVEKAELEKQDNVREAVREHLADTEQAAHHQQAEEISMARKRPGMRSRDEWELDGLYSIVESEQTKDPRRNEVREESTNPNIKQDFYKSGKQQHEEVDFLEIVEEGKEKQAYYDEQMQAIDEKYGQDYRPYTVTDDMSAADIEVEKERYVEQEMTRQENEQSQEIGQDHDQGMER